MPNDIQQITPKAEVPAWVTKTPHETAYSLTLWSDEGQGDDINVSRAEYIALKKYLAGLRGLPVPKDDDEPETAPARVDLAETKTKSSLDQIKIDLADDIAEIVKGNATIGIGGIDQSTILGDLYLLKDIVQYWEQCNATKAHPGESPLIAAIRDRLDK